MGRGATIKLRSISIKFIMNKEKMKYIFGFLVFLFSMLAYGEKNTEYIASEIPSDTAIYGKLTIDKLLDESEEEGDFVWGNEITIKFEDLEKILIKNQDDVPMIDIVYKVPSINLAKDVEEKISRPLEAVLSEIEGVEHVYSESKKGQAKIIVQFIEGIEYFEALSLVKKTVSLSKNKLLLKGLEKPMIMKSMDAAINHEEFAKFKTNLLLTVFAELCQETGKGIGVSKKLEAEKLLQECIKSLEKTE
jgi:hypothetical protein